MVTDFPDKGAMGQRDLVDVRRVNDKLAPSATTGSSLYMHLPPTQSSSYISGAHESTVRKGRSL
jgi:hypothetical protein